MKSFTRFVPFLPTRALCGTFALGSFSFFSSSSSSAAADASHFIRKDATLYPPYPDEMEVSLVFCPLSYDRRCSVKKMWLIVALIVVALMFVRGFAFAVFAGVSSSMLFSSLDMYPN